MTRPLAVVVGAGFGGLNVAKALSGKPVEVLILDRYNYHLFQPLLYQVATGGLEPGEIAYPVRRIIRRLPNIAFQMAEVSAIHLPERRLDTDVGPIQYDYLVLAAGSENNFFGLEELSRTALGLKGLQEADTVRNHLLACFERAVALPPGPARDALLTFVICGGGSTGVEFAGALAELVQVVRSDLRGAIGQREVRLVLVEGEPDLVSMMHPSLRRAALRELQRRGVEVHLHQRIKDYDGRAVTLADGSSIASGTLMWAAGVRASALAETAGLQLARGHRIPVSPVLSLPEHPEVYVIGDMAYLEQEGRALPQVAPVAMQQAAVAAANIVRQLQGLRPKPFHYRDKGTLSVIGRRAAVAQFGPIRLSGAVAWLMWLMVHIVMLIGFRNRIVVLVDWATSYFSYEPASRLITRR